MTSDGDDTGRDEQGRFTKGNPGGPGGSRKRMFTLRRAAEEAITPEHIEAMIRKATRLALEGNLSAMRLVLERTCGRPADGPQEAEPIDVTLPVLRSASDCSQATEELIDGIVKGSLNRDDAQLLIDAVQARLRAIEVKEIEERLVELERAAHSVDYGNKPRPRRRF